MLKLETGSMVGHSAGADCNVRQEIQIKDAALFVFNPTRYLSTYGRSLPTIRLSSNIEILFAFSSSEHLIVENSLTANAHHTQAYDIFSIETARGEGFDVQLQASVRLPVIPTTLTQQSDFTIPRHLDL